MLKGGDRFTKDLNNIEEILKGVEGNLSELEIRKRNKQHLLRSEDCRIQVKQNHLIVSELQKMR
jgi:hypothetical protein